MKLKILIAITIAVILICAAPVSAANVTYPQEYYDLQAQSISEISQAENPNGLTMLATERALMASYYELRRQTILLEKQNELQAELVKAQWVEMCYAPRYEGGANHANFSAWKSECANAGYPVG